MPEKKKKNINEKCNEEVIDNYKGCLEIISSVNKWNLIEVKAPEDDKKPERIAGVVMGEPCFIEFVNKAITSYMDKKVIMEMMKDIFSDEKENGPTKH